jgi:hypothetical protein
MKYTNTPFELFDGTKCMLHVAVGEVIQNDAREVQDVHVSNDQTKVYTSKTQRQAIWLRDDNGGEKEIHLDAIAPFSVRVGQTMAVAMASSDQTSPMFLAEGRNLKTGGWSTTNEDRLFKQVVPNACRRRLNSDPPCRSNFDPGMGLAAKRPAVDNSTSFLLSSATSR